MKYFVHWLLLISSIILVTACRGKEIHRPLTDDQVNFLNTIPSGTSIRFNVYDSVSTLIVGTPKRYNSTSQDHGGMFTKPSTFYTEHGELSYDSPNNGLGIFIRAIGDGGQDISIDYAGDVGPTFSIHFDQAVVSRTINGVTYSDLMLGIDELKQDTLFWEKNIGIIGWKRANDNYTVYRLF